MNKIFYKNMYLFYYLTIVSPQNYGVNCLLEVVSSTLNDPFHPPFCYTCLNSVLRLHNFCNPYSLGLSRYSLGLSRYSLGLPNLCNPKILFKQV